MNRSDTSMDPALEQESISDDEESTIVLNTPSSVGSAATIDLTRGPSEQAVVSDCYVILERVPVPKKPTLKKRRRLEIDLDSSNVYFDHVDGCRSPTPIRCRLRSFARQERTQQSELRSNTNKRRKKRMRVSSSPESVQRRIYKGCRRLVIPLTTPEEILRLRLADMKEIRKEKKNARKDSKKKRTSSSQKAARDQSASTKGSKKTSKKKRQSRTWSTYTRKSKKNRNSTKIRREDGNQSIAKAVEAVFLNGGDDDFSDIEGTCDGIGNDDEPMGMEAEDAAQRWETEKTRNDQWFPKKKTSAPKEAQSSSTIEKKNRKRVNRHPSSTEQPVTNVPQNQAPLPTGGQKKQPVPLFRIVTDADPEQCKFCKRMCGRESPLKRHLDRHHHFRCETCILTFNTTKELNKHRRLLHRTRHRCELCEKDFLTEKVYENHKKGRMHQLLEKAQAKMLNVVVEKLNLKERFNIRPLDGEERDDIIYCRVAKEEKIGPILANVRAHSSNVEGYFFEQTENSSETPAIPALMAAQQQSVFVNNMPYKAPDATQGSAFQSIAAMPTIGHALTPETGTSMNFSMANGSNILVLETVTTRAGPVTRNYLRMTKQDAVTAKTRVIEEVEAALADASDEIVQQAYDLGLLDRPINLAEIEADALVEEVLPEAAAIQNSIVMSETVVTNDSCNYVDSSENTDQEITLDESVLVQDETAEYANVFVDPASFEDDGFIAQIDKMKPNENLPSTTLTAADLDDLLTSYDCTNAGPFKNAVIVGGVDKSPLLSSVNITSNEPHLEQLLTTMTSFGGDEDFDAYLIDDNQDSDFCHL